MTSFVGVDLHRNNFTYCIRENGEEKKIGKCEISDLKGFASLLGKNTVMAVEATGNTFMFCRFLKAHVGRLVVVNPSQFKVISMSTKKTDRHDAKVLAEFLEKDMLPEVRMKDDLQAKISSLTQTREKLVQLRTVLKNKVNDIFDLLEFDMLELSFEITLFNSFYHPPVKIEMFANCGNCHFRSQFNDCPFKCRRNSGLGMRDKWDFLHGSLATLRTINPVNVKFKKCCFRSIW